MNPNLFLMNTDFLTLAKHGVNTFDVTIPSHTYAANTYGHETIDIPVDTPKGAIPIFAVRYKTGSDDKWYFTNGKILVDRKVVIDESSWAYDTWQITFSRKNSTTISAEWIFLPGNNSVATTAPEVSFEIKMVTFYPPNVS